MTQVTMRQLLEAGVHFGHRTRYWNPAMAPYIFGARNRIHIINLEHTLPLLKESCHFASRMAADRGRILFVGTKRSAQEVVREEATRCGMPYVNHRWLGGMLTNFKTVKQSIKRMTELEEIIGEDAQIKLVKKEALALQREYDKLHKSLHGIRDLTSLPDALFVIDVGYEAIAIKEARKLGIPVIGVVDTNNSPKDVDNIIPGNDDATRAIRVYAQAIADSVLDGRGSVTVAPKDDALEADKPSRAKPKAAKPAEVKTKPAPKAVSSESAAEPTAAAPEASEAPAATDKPTETSE